MYLKSQEVPLCIAVRDKHRGGSAPAVCQIDMLPATCSWSTEDFVLDYEILEKGAQIYEIKGTAKKIGGTSGTFTDYSRASFTLLIIHNGVIVESIRIAGGSGSFDRGITFKREFSTENTFEATILIYEMQVMG